MVLLLLQGLLLRGVGPEEGREEWLGGENRAVAAE
jgi:hypothetical protein